MKYKILVLDLDGTLTNQKKEITPHTHDILIKAQQMGVRIVLASGRPTYGIAPLAEQLELKKYGGYILSYNGCEIINWQTGELLYSKTLDSSVIPYLYKCASDHHFTIATYHDKYVFTENTDDIYVQKAAKLNIMTLKKVNKFTEAVHFPVPKCLIMGDAHRLASFEKMMHKKLQEQVGVFRSEPYFLELVPNGIDKAHSLAILLKETGVSREETIAIGDGFNDLSMIKFAGLGVAMNNAQEIIKKHANHITLSNEEDGVAAVVEQFIF